MARVPMIVATALRPWVAWANRPPRIDVPCPALPSPNAIEHFDEAARLAKQARHCPLERTTLLPGPPPEALLRAAYREAECVVASIRRGLAGESRHRPVRSFAASAMPDFAIDRRAARVAVGAAAFPLRRGQVAEAAATLLDAAHFGVAIVAGGPLIADLVGLACEATALSHLEPLLPVLSPPDLQRVAERLKRIPADRTPYSEVVMEEAWAALASMQAQLREARSLRQQVALAQEWTRTALSDEPVTLRDALEATRVVLTDKPRAARQNLAYGRAVARECQAPYTDGSRVPMPRNALARCGATLDVLSGARRQHVALEAAMAVLTAEVALLRHRADHGRYPGTLDALAPRYLHRVPTDPFGGSAGVPLRYRAENDGRACALYSVGANMRDDGGRPSASPVDIKGDIVGGRLWPMRRAL